MAGSATSFSNASERESITSSSRDKKKPSPHSSRHSLSSESFNSRLQIRTNMNVMDKEIEEQQNSATKSTARLSDSHRRLLSSKSSHASSTHKPLQETPWNGGAFGTPMGSASFNTPRTEASPNKDPPSFRPANPHVPNPATLQHPQQGYTPGFHPQLYGGPQMYGSSQMQRMQGGSQVYGAPQIYGGVKSYGGAHRGVEGYPSNHHPQMLHHAAQTPSRFVSGALPRHLTPSPLTNHRISSSPVTVTPLNQLQPVVELRQMRNTTQSELDMRADLHDREDEDAKMMAFDEQLIATNDQSRQVIHVPVFRVTKRILMKRQRQGCCGFFNLGELCSAPDGMCAPLNFCGCLDREVTTKYFPDGRVKTKVHPIHLPCC